MKAENFEELEEQQNHLRIQRNNLTNKYRSEIDKIQKQIDELDLQKYCADKFEGKYICITKNENAAYIHVDKVDRLFAGPRFCGKGFYVCIDSDGDYISVNCYNDIDESVTYEDVFTVKEITKEEYNNALKNTLYNIEHFICE